MWTYKAENGNTITISDENLKSIMEREGLALVPEKKTKKEE